MSAMMPANAGEEAEVPPTPEKLKAGPVKLQGAPFCALVPADPAKQRIQKLPLE
jgi:hypothetical protein